MRKLILLLFCMCLVLTGCGRMEEQKFPPKPQDNIYVVDSAGMINDEYKQKMLQLGEALDKKHKAQIVVVTIESLGGTSIEEYANNLFRLWGIGDKKQNNGILFLVSKKDRKFRIEIGYGLEGKIPDSKAGAILQNIKGYFKNKQYAEGTYVAYVELTKLVYEEYGDTETA